MIVLDASVVVETLLRTPAGEKLDRQLFDSDLELHSPCLLDVEAAQVIRRYWLSGQVDEPRAREAIEDLADLPINRHEHTLLLPRIWELRSSMTSYDAAYVALAEGLRATLLTRDRRLAGASGHRARISVV